MKRACLFFFKFSGIQTEIISDFWYHLIPNESQTCWSLSFSNFSDQNSFHKSCQFCLRYKVMFSPAIIAWLSLHNSAKDILSNVIPCTKDSILLEVISIWSSAISSAAHCTNSNFDDREMGNWTELHSYWNYFLQNTIFKSNAK